VTIRGRFTRGAVQCHFGKYLANFVFNEFLDVKGLLQTLSAVTAVTEVAYETCHHPMRVCGNCKLAFSCKPIRALSHV
jgi:hypothetical protein